MDNQHRKIVGYRELNENVSDWLLAEGHAKPYA